MAAQQTPLADILRGHAEDLHSEYGYNKSARLLSMAADEIERLRAALTLVMRYPGIRQYIGSKVAGVAEAALRSKENGS
jgi:hypothetical protein